MEESEKEALFSNLKGVLDSIIKDKRKNPKNLKNLEKFKARINLGYQKRKLILRIISHYIFFLILRLSSLFVSPTY